MGWPKGFNKQRSLIFDCAFKQQQQQNRQKVLALLRLEQRVKR